jgi:leader peptidase (prepilin peptidase)/N-methyltransferase
MISGLIVLSLIDWRTYEIPFGINVYLFILGIIREVYDGISATIILDFLIVSGFLMLIYIVTKGKGIGGGDIKLMAVAGLLLGSKLVLVAFILGCFYGSVIHIIRMKISKADHMLAMGPYLSAGILTAAWFGEQIIAWYTVLWIQ